MAPFLCGVLLLFKTFNLNVNTNNLTLFTSGPVLL